MAYFVHAEPSNTDSLFTPLWFKLGSDNANLANFRYVLTLWYDDGSTLYPITVLRIMPDAGFAGFIDVSRIIRGYIASYFAPDNTTLPPIAINTNANRVAYAVDFGEEYGASGSITQYLGIDFRYYTAYNTYNVDTPTNGQPFAPLAGYENKWLTSRDKSAVWIKGTAYVSFWNEAAQDYNIQIDQLDADGAVIGLLPTITQTPYTAAGNLVVINLDPAIMSAASWLVPPGISTWAGYRVRLVTTGAADITGWLNVFFLCEARTAATRLHFLNRFGGFDTFYFTGPTRKELEVERKTYERIPMVDRSTFVTEYSSKNVYADTTVVFNTRHTSKRKLVSGYVKDTDHNWLAELIASPQIWLQEGGYYFPVTINEKSWTQKLIAFDKMYNLEIEITIGRKVISQSR